MIPGPLLLYDGTCGICGATVRFVLRHDRRGTVRFAPLDGPTAAGVVGRHPELAGVDSVVWVDPAEPGGGREAVAVRSDAVLRAAGYLGGAWHAARLARLIPRGLRDRAYDWIAKHRHRLARDRCYLPPPEARDRFLP
jgi:predicted DCC family thiol-disulfide oxidoreductase YuxK